MLGEIAADTPVSCRARYRLDLLNLRRIAALCSVPLLAVLVAGCYGKTMPVNSAAPATCVPTRILFVGDSVLANASQAIRDEFSSNGYNNELKFVTRAGSTVAEYSAIDRAPWFWATPRDELQWYLDTFQPDVVVAEWGANKVETLWWGGFDWLMPWAVANGMQDVKNRVAAAGAQLFWTTIPIRNAHDGQAVNDFVNGVVNDQLIHGLGVPLVDWRDAVVPEGGPVYAESLQYHEDEQVHVVRTKDGIHLSTDGNIRAAKWTLRDLASVACKP